MRSMPSRRSKRATLPRIVIVGMMGAGKTSVGRELAGKSGSFIDLDRAIEDREGRTVREIFAAEGEAAFRELEVKMLQEVLSSSQHSVIATGGGVITTEAGRHLLKDADAYVVWLTASNEELARRATKSGARPLLDTDPLARIDELMKQRASLYAEVANLSLETDGLSVRQVAHLIEENILHDTGAAGDKT